MNGILAGINVNQWVLLLVLAALVAVSVLLLWYRLRISPFEALRVVWAGLLGKLARRRSVTLALGARSRHA